MRGLLRLSVLYSFVVVPQLLSLRSTIAADHSCARFLAPTAGMPPPALFGLPALLPVSYTGTCR